MFGHAGFGIFASIFVATRVERDNGPNQKRTRAAGAFGLFGTLVLFITYAVFNSANVPYWLTVSGGISQLNAFFTANTPGATTANVIATVGSITTRTYLNTLCGVAASVIAGFMHSYQHTGKIDYAIIQRA
jgi:hypothetical protein